MEAIPASAPAWLTPERLKRFGKLALGGVAIVVGLWVLDLLGIPVGSWISDFWNKLAEVPTWAVVAGVILQTAVTMLVALAWLGIVRAAWPEAQIPYRIVLASYATGVALNGFLPANIGTFVYLVMIATLVAGATFAAMASGLVVQAIPFSVLNIGLYLYLFLTVEGSFSIKLGLIADHPVLIGGIVAGAVVLVALLVRIFWKRLDKLREQVAVGGRILASPRDMIVRVALPELGSYLARLGVIAVFLGAYGIPVTFHSVASVSASNSISNAASVTPGGVGVNQALNTAALRGDATRKDATAYSVSQQLITTSWNIAFALILVVWVFGWTGGRQLVESSYADAKERSQAEREKRRERKAAKRART